MRERQKYFRGDHGPGDKPKAKRGREWEKPNPVSVSCLAGSGLIMAMDFAERVSESGSLIGVG